MRTDDTPITNFTKEEIEQIVEDKFYDLLAEQESQKELLGPEFLEMAENVVLTGAGKSHEAKKKDSRPIIETFPNELQLRQWMFRTTGTMNLKAMLGYEIEEQEDGTFIVY